MKRSYTLALNSSKAFYNGGTQKLQAEQYIVYVNLLRKVESKLF